MKLEQIEKYFIDADTDRIAFDGHCHDCRKEVIVNCNIEEDGKLNITGGAVYLAGVIDKEVYLKCDKCFDLAAELRNFQPVKTYSRVVGYYQPIKNWNKGKRAEFDSRKTFDIGRK